VLDHVTQGLQSVTTKQTLLPTNDPTHTTHCGKQQIMGWKQLIYRCYAQQWITEINQQELHINGHNFITKIIYLTWQKVTAQWKMHNSHHHPPMSENID